MTIVRWVSLLALITWASIATGVSAPAQKPLHHPRWQAIARVRGFSEEDIRRLTSQRILITSERYKQVFEPYESSDIPVFITTDSLLNAYHVLFEESVRRLEARNARLLPRVLKFLLDRLPDAAQAFSGRAELVAQAQRRATIMLGTALRLLGRPATNLPPDVESVVEVEEARVEGASGIEALTWFPDVKLDYSRFLPRGLYADSELMQRYFRAISFLQAIPFRRDVDDEFLTVFMVSQCFHSTAARTPPQRREFSAIFQIFDHFLEKDESDAFSLSGSYASRYDLDRGDLKMWQHMSRQGYVSDVLGRDTGTGTLRILSAHRTLDAVALQQIWKLQHAMPRGRQLLEVLASGAQDSPRPNEFYRIANLLRQIRPTSALQAQYFDCLTALLAPAEVDAPPFMRSPAWRLKSVQTALASWAQMRHTWALQSKSSVEYLGMHPPPTGFVEPNPVFYRRLATLVRCTEQAFDGVAAFDVDTRDIADQMRICADNLEKTTGSNLNGEQIEMLLSFEALVPSTSSDRKEQIVANLQSVAADLEQGHADPERLREYEEATNANLTVLWTHLQILALRLENLAQQQLRGIAPDADDAAFIGRYGDELGPLMLYAGNSYEVPRDDAARITDVFSIVDESLNARYLEVGIGRPHAIYVLYPWKGQEILCRGAVLPYFEFERANRLTDADWRSMVDTATMPHAPPWLSSLQTPSKTGPPRSPH